LADLKEFLMVALTDVMTAVMMVGMMVELTVVMMAGM